VEDIVVVDMGVLVVAVVDDDVVVDEVVIVVVVTQTWSDVVTLNVTQYSVDWICTLIARKKIVKND